MKNTLTVKRPSPTTVLYKVSTRSATTTLTTRIRRTIIGLVRILTGLTLLCILTAKAHTSATPRWKSHTNYASTFLPPSLTEVSTTTASRIPWLYLAPISLVLFSAIFKKGYTTESLLVIRGMGVQTTTSSPTYLSTATTRFIPTNMIQDIFVYEAFKGFEVRFYLAIVVEGEHDVVVVFPVSFLSFLYVVFHMYNADSWGQSILPRRRVLEEVWRGAKSCLYEPKS
jgi:phosphatidylinositol glycan class H protein